MFITANDFLNPIYTTHFTSDSDNRLATFPLEFCGMKQLDMLDLSMNKITQVPDGVGNLQVVELNLNQNQVTGIGCEFDDSISEASNIASCR